MKQEHYSMEKGFCYLVQGSVEIQHLNTKNNFYQSTEEIISPK